MQRAKFKHNTHLTKHNTFSTLVITPHCNIIRFSWFYAQDWMLHALLICSQQNVNFHTRKTSLLEFLCNQFIHVCRFDMCSLLRLHTYSTVPVVQNTHCTQVHSARLFAYFYYNKLFLRLRLGIICTKTCNNTTRTIYINAN